MQTLKWVLLAALALPAAAQPPAKPEPVRKLIELKYADAQSVKSALSIFGCCVEANPSLKLVGIVAPPDVAPLMEEAIKKIDVPPAVPKNVELTAWFLIGAEKEIAAGSSVPVDLDPVLKQIRAVFAYKNFRLLDTMILRTRPGQRASINGASGLGPAAGTAFSIRAATPVAGEKGTTIRLESLHAGLAVPIPDGKGGIRYQDTGISGVDMDIAEGQKVVVGKSSMEGAEKALIVILSAKVL